MRSNVERILLLDLLATDFFHGPAFPTLLCFNPYDGPRAVELDVGPRPCDVYDAASHRFLVTAAVGTARVTIPGDSAVVAVLVPSGRKPTQAGTQLRVGGVVVDYRYPPRRDARP